MDRDQQHSIKIMQVFSLILIFCIGWFVVWSSMFNKESNEDISTPEFVVSTPIVEPEPIEEQAPPIKKVLPPSVTLAVPFYVQAPDNKRVLPWTEACSEANLVLAAYYIQNKVLTKDQFKKDILAMTKVQDKFFDTYIEIPMIKLKKLYDRFYPKIGTSKIIDNPTIEQIKEELAQGNIVIVPTAGKELNNPYYLEYAPRFHTVLIRWYDDKYFYANDVGISRGENFPYLQEVIMEANHDLVDGDITQWAKRILVIEK